MNSRFPFPAILLIQFVLLSSCDNAYTETGAESAEQEMEPVTGEWQLVWSDEFDSDDPDWEKWSYQYGSGSDEGLAGWGNNELQYYTDREQNVYVKDGMLHIVAREESYQEMNYTSARIRTIEKGDWMYGKIIIRAKLSQGQGIWPAIWMLPTDQIYGGWPKSGEIDIMELVGHEPETVHGTVHFGPDWPENKYTGASFTLDEGTFADDFHTFSIEWMENEIRWFVDDIQYFSVTPSNLQPHPYPFNARFHLILNVAVGGNWPGNPDEATEFPQSRIVDYIRVYQIK
jgi:beta-glucanase (GH16 family)